MNNVLQIFLLIGIVAYFGMIFIFLKKKSVSLKYSLLWIFTGIIMTIVVLFPAIMKYVSEILGIESEVNAVFVLAAFFLMLIVMSLTSIVSKQNEKITRLIQEQALLEKRVRDLHNDMKN